MVDWIVGFVEQFRELSLFLVMLGIKAGVLAYWAIVLLLGLLLRLFPALK